MNSPSSEMYDAVVIGSGQGGNPLAIALANAGYRTALIERAHVGGTCVNHGCTPTKTMIASARVAYLARRSHEYGVPQGDLAMDMETVRLRKRNIVQSFRSGNERSIEGTENLELIRGEARFVDASTIEILRNDGRIAAIRATRVFINTGTSPGTPPISGLTDVDFLDSTSIMELDHVPKHLIVLGGGYVGVEFGQMFRRFGAEVTILHRGKRLLAHEDDDISDEIAKILRDDGITIHLGAEAKRVQRSVDGTIRLKLESGEGTASVSGSHLLVATGRRPNTGDLNLGAAGITGDERGYIAVNDKLETNVENVYALGDVKGGPAFTHISYHDHLILRANVLDGENRSIAGRMVPYTVFTDPQLGRAGLTEQEAKERGLDYGVARIPMARVARAIETDETRGFMKAIVDRDNKQILGCAVLGLEGGEIASIIQVAMMGRLPYTDLRDGIFSHPTLAESLNSLFASIE